MCNVKKLINMKISYKKFLFLFALMYVPFGVNAQRIHTGADASSQYRNAEVVRESNYSTLPSFIKFRKSEQIDIDMLNAWMKSNFKLDPNIGFIEVRKDVDNLGHVHYRYQQTYYGQPVEDAIWIAHTNQDKIYSLNGLIYDKFGTASSPSLTEASALVKALEHVGAEVYKWELAGEETHLKWESGNPNATYFPKGEVVFVSKDMTFKAEDYRLAYKFNVYGHAPVSRADIYVDAITGEILRENSILCHADEEGTAHTAYSDERLIIADSFGGEYRLRDGSRGDGVRTFDMNQGTSYGDAVDFIDDDNDWDNVNPEEDEVATDAHWGSEMTYDYYFDIHGRNSIDNAGFQLNSYVHYDAAYDNAFWDGSRMTYGDGNVSFSPLTSIDVAGHEVTHGLTSNTAGLIYSMESGALNESFSDIFGTAIENFGRPDDWNWTLGEDIGIFGPLRSIENPNAEGDPDTYFGDFWADLDGGDSGGVHTNSGVQNFWYYLLTEGGVGTNDNGDDYDVSAVDFEASSSIAFRNLTVYLTPSSNFADARFFAIESAVDLYGVCTFEVEQTANAWYAVGVGDIYNPITEADFFTADSLGCAIPFTVNFSNESTNAITYEWDFGDGETSTEENPVHVYTEAGVYTVTLFADGGDCGTDEVIFTDYITVNPDADCIVILPETGTASTQNGCDGTAYDSGGPDADYGDGEDAMLTISPLGALSIDLSFPVFDVEEGPGVTCDYDYLDVFDGPDEFSPLIDRYCNNNLPTDITSTGSSVTIVFHSDGGAQGEGFEIEWSCNLPEDAPVTDFTVNSESSCTGEVFFTDLSTNAPTEWAWDFGDGGTSDEQHPSHVYASEGTYTVTLTANNLIGGDTEIKAGFVTVSYPVSPTAVGDSNCPTEVATLTASGDGDLKWFDVPVGGAPIFEGASFTTPPLDLTTTYYVESDLFDDPQFVGPADGSFGGGGYFSGDQHLVFDNPSPTTLWSVDVDADGSGNRTIELRSNTGDVLETRIVNIPDGESTVILDIPLPVGTSLQLGSQVGSSPALFRNNTGTPAYPFELAESVTILSSSAGPEYYYHFYNWEIHAYTCASDRVEAVAEVLDESDVEIDLVDDICIQGAPITMTASAGGGTWSADCGSCIDETTGVFDPALSGGGSFEITYDIDGTCSYVNTITVDVIDCLGLNDEDKYEISIYPNPTKGLVTITTGNVDQGTIVIKDVLGKTIANFNFNSNKITVDLNDFQARGTYFVEFFDQNDNLMTVKKVVKH
ncbi:MAG: Zn-dependent metalloprotease/chitodextrinase [Crocinitomix sp.]